MMRYQSVLLIGGAGFVGSNLALKLKARYGDCRVAALDNLKRRGSEFNLARLREAGVDFMHGDVRCPEDLRFAVGSYDLVIECSAEPSVLAGYGSDPAYLIQTNLVGTANCLELARQQGAGFLFLSTSRVYPIHALVNLRHEETDTRFQLTAAQAVAGASEWGISEDFPLSGHRSLYGATKLASEHLVEEYVHVYGLDAVIDRCGVITGPWQMGKVDQGVFALWVMAHYFGRPLSYVGYGGGGKQVRDLIHVDDLFEVIDLQLREFPELSGSLFNIGGGRGCSLSLRETTEICRELTGNVVPIRTVPEDRPGDIPIFITDARRVSSRLGWDCTNSPYNILDDIYRWVRDHEQILRQVAG